MRASEFITDINEELGEAAYPGNLGMLEVTKFFQTASDNQKNLFKELLEKGKKGLAWKLIQDTIGVKLQGREFEVNENFADGKVKGKSRPGRVKRAGASCAGSVTDLRRRAKNSSGEKAKMYHWCANMKSGKKKN